MMKVDNIVLEIKFGSYLYGTSTEKSDLDIVGIFMPSEEQLFGLEHIEQIDLSKKSKDEDGKNTSDAIDKKYYEYKKFISNLYHKNSPNMLEILFVNEENILKINEYGRNLLNNRQMFVSKRIVDKFIGYANSQRHKIFIKADNYHNLINMFDLLSKKDRKQFLVESIKEGQFNGLYKINYQENGNLSFIQIGDINIHPYSTVGGTIDKIKKRIDKFSNRTELIDKFGYDTKFAYNLIRLLMELNELLETGALHFPLKECELLLDIKNGKWELVKILEHSRTLIDKSKELELKSIIPNKTNYDEVNSFLISQLREWSRDGSY